MMDMQTDKALARNDIADRLCLTEVGSEWSAP